MRFLLFFLALNIQIQVKASSVVQDPKGCLDDQIWCSLYNASWWGQNSELDWVEVGFSSKSGVVLLPEKKVRVLSGMIHLRAKEDLKVEGYNLKLVLKKGQQAFLAVTNEKILVRAIMGEVTVNPRGHKRSYQILPGFENWFGGMKEDGEVVMGFPRPLDLRSHLRDWSKTYAKDRWEFRQEAKEFTARWREAIEQGAVLNKEFVLRSLASLEKQRSIEKVRRKKQADIDAEMRRLFRKRNGL